MKIQMIISIDAKKKKDVTKQNTRLWLKNNNNNNKTPFGKLEIKENFLSLIKGINKKSKANITLMVKDWMLSL